MLKWAPHLLNIEINNNMKLERKYSARVMKPNQYGLKWPVFRVIHRSSRMYME